MDHANRQSKADGMSLSNYQLFEMMNASPGTTGAGVWVGLVLAYGSIGLVSALFLFLWRELDGPGRRELGFAVTAACIALVACEVFGFWWPQPRPVALHMGVQLSPFPMRDSGFPSGEIAALVTLGLSAFATQQLAVLGFPLLTLALLAGWSLVYTGEHFPFDVVGALPVAIGCAVVAAVISRARRPHRGWPRI